MYVYLFLLLRCHNDRHVSNLYFIWLQAPNSQLLTTLYHKYRYKIHYRNLKQAVDHGFGIIKMLRVLQFRQEPWLKSYIDLNTPKRQEAKNEFEKNLFKLMNNAVFGKTMEDVKRRGDIKLLTKWEGRCVSFHSKFRFMTWTCPSFYASFRYGAEAFIAKPNFHSRSIFAPNLVGIQLNKTEVLLKKPMYVGFSVLDISKSCLYRFHYDVMPKLVGDVKFSLSYTDTDSLIYNIETDDVYQRIKANIEHFDTSDFPDPNPYNMARINKKIVGLMKDGCSGEPLTEFVGLRSKIYSVRVNGEDKLKTAKTRSMVSYREQFSLTTTSGVWTITLWNRECREQLY